MVGKEGEGTLDGPYTYIHTHNIINLNLETLIKNKKERPHSENAGRKINH